MITGNHHLVPAISKCLIGWEELSQITQILQIHVDSLVRRSLEKYVRPRQSLGRTRVDVKPFTEAKKGAGHRYIVQLVNTSKVPAISIKLNLKDPKTGKIMLPAYFSDGYFNLLPGKSKLVHVDSPVTISGSAVVIVDGYNIR